MDKNNRKLILCPNCGKKTRLMVTPDTVIEKLPLFCPKCKRETVVSIKNNLLIKK